MPPAPQPAAQTPQTSSDGVTPEQEAAWALVETCESHGVVAHGPTYFGVLGISGTNWVAYGGTEFAPTADLASFDQQVIVAMRIQSSPPDQDGICAAW